MKYLLFLMLFVVASCGEKLLGVNFGKTTKKELIASKGEPLEEQTVPGSKSTEVIVFENNEKYQLEDGTVTHLMREPKGDETNLLYWKHKFKKCDTTTKQISKPTGHEFPEFQLTCSEMGLAVVYQSDSESILKVIEFENK